MLSHPVNPPDLSLPNYFAFLKLKTELKGDRYKNILEIQTSVKAKLKVIPIHEWAKVMKRLKDCAKECIHGDGNDFE